MAEATIHGIEFQISGSASSAANSLDKLASNLSKIKSATNGGIGLGKIASELRSLNKAIENTNLTSLTLYIAALRKMGNLRVSGRLAKGLAQIGNALSGIKAGNLTRLVDSLSALSNVGQGKIDASSLSAIRGELENIASIDFSNLNGVADKISSISAAKSRSGYALDDPSHQWAKDMARQVEYEDKGFWANLRETADIGGVEAAFRRIGAVLSDLAGMFSKTSSAAKETSSALQSVKPSANSSANSIKEVGKAAKNADKPMSRFISSLKRIAFYRILRSILKSITQAFQEGLKNAYQFDKVAGGELAAALDSIATKSLTMKNQLGAAFGGLITALTPAILTAINLITKLSAAITRLIAILGGSDTWLRAKDVFTEWGDAAESAGGAAKKALEYLAPFDELNVLPDPKSGGGGGANTPAYGDMFEWVSVEEGAGLADAIAEAFQGVANFFESKDWAAIADSAWEGLKTAFSDTGKASQVVRSLSEALGAALGAVASFLWETIKNIAIDIWDALKRNITDNNGDGVLSGKEIINGVLKGIVEAIKNIGTWIKDNVWTPFITGFKKAFGIASPATTMKPIGADIANGVLEGIKNVFANIKTWVSDNILKPLQKAIDTAKEKITVGIGLVRKGWDYVSTWIKDNFMGASTPQKGIGIVRKGWDFVSNWIKNNWMGQSTPQKGIGVVRKGWDFVSNWIINNWMGASTPNKGIGIVRKGWDYVSTWIKDNWMGASTPEKGIGIIRKGWDYVSNWVKDKWMGNASTDQSVGLWKNGWNSVTDWVSNAVTGTVSQATSLFINGSTIADRLSYYGNFLADAYLNIIGQTNTPTVAVNASYNVPMRTAKGGAFYGGNWHDIPQAASGGLFHGSLFWAGEAGPELVGHAGGRTEVLNRSQIAATMYASIRSAMSSVGVRVSAPSSDSYGENEDVVYRAIVRALNDTGVDGDIELDGDVLYRKMVQYNKKNTRLTGVNAMA